ncbi:hypothetical protein GPECTOR_24g227 [Gonium pectorale]|uniref:Uncharacterized protein n=1 Tax=Gonium pectorale TaxID=33097 RepID=A0A150GGH2_GONPE|nr:hypothetical protein GPECTOR_24g227 [Gonium pectorale]|eukprot:KXZ48937.1 hypothetical protein GPECTOR_24g227 [Gonium pectorale]
MTTYDMDTMTTYDTDTMTTYDTEQQLESVLEAARRPAELHKQGISNMEVATDDQKWALDNMRATYNPATLTRRAAGDMLKKLMAIKLVALKRLVLEFGMDFATVVQLSEEAGNELLGVAITASREQVARGGAIDDVLVESAAAVEAAGTAI